MTSSSFDRATAFYVAKLAELAEDYEMVAQMREVATKVPLMTLDERKLLQKGYGKYITTRRDSWTKLSKLEWKEESEGNEENVARIHGYKKKLETEITRICFEVLSIIDEYLLPSNKTSEGFVFYHTMKGDYYRYRAEIKSGTNRQKDAELALQVYEKAMTTAVAKLPRSHPARLGLDLNLAVYYHDILGKPTRAYQIADNTFDEVLPGLTDLSPEDKKESNHWLHCLNDNMTLWSRLSSREEFNLD